MKQVQPPITRRDFLQVAGGAGAFTLVRPEAVRGSQVNSRISVGVIGVGNRGTFVAAIMHADPRARVTALCDLFNDQIEKATPKIKVEKPAIYKDFEKLLASDVDAVVIATPVFEHPRMLEAVVQARKHIYCEKPMGVDAEGCRRVIATARKADPKRCLTVGFQQRYGPGYLEAYKRIREGQIGEISVARAAWISGEWFQPFLHPEARGEEARLRNWFCYPELSGDIIVEQDCHNLDVLHWFLGATPVRAIGWGGRKVRTSMAILDHLNLTFEFPNGIHVNYEANQITPPGFRRAGEEFTGTKGTIATARGSMVHMRSRDDIETIKSERDITYDAVEGFLQRVASSHVENTAERSALSTMIGILGRTAIYTGKEQSWKGLFGA
jgi:predicted dehydrogenase